MELLSSAHVQETNIDDCCTGHRRAFLRGSLAALAGVVAFPAIAGASGDILTKAERDAMTPDQVLKMVLDGNQRFLAGNTGRRDWLAEQRGTAAGQYPAAVFLSCVDSRVPVEVVCDLGIGEMFSARVAGNVANDDIMGSLEFATAAAGAKLVAVMGHSACGAVKGAIDNVRLGNLTLLLSRFGNAIDATSYAGDRSAKNPEFVDQVARTNVKMTIDTMRDRSRVLRDLEQQGKIKMVGMFYELDTGKVSVIA